MDKNIWVFISHYSHHYQGNKWLLWQCGIHYDILGVYLYMYVNGHSLLCRNT